MAGRSVKARDLVKKSRNLLLFPNGGGYICAEVSFV